MDFTTFQEKQIRKNVYPMFSEIGLKAFLYACSQGTESKKVCEHCVWPKTGFVCIGWSTPHMQLMVAVILMAASHSWIFQPDNLKFPGKTSLLVDLMLTTLPVPLMADINGLV